MIFNIETMCEMKFWKENKLSSDYSKLRINGKIVFDKSHKLSSCQFEIPWIISK